MLTPHVGQWIELPGHQGRAQVWSLGPNGDVFVVDDNQHTHKIAATIFRHLHELRPPKAQT